MQPGVRFAHGVQFWMPKRTLLSRTHTQNNSWRFKTCKNMHGRMCKQKHIKGEKQKWNDRERGTQGVWGRGQRNDSMSHQIYRCPFLSSWGVLALAFSDTASKWGRSTQAGRQREKIHTLRAERYNQNPTLGKTQKSLDDSRGLLQDRGTLFF